MSIIKRHTRSSQGGISIYLSIYLLYIIIYYKIYIAFTPSPSAKKRQKNDVCVFVKASATFRSVSGLTVFFLLIFFFTQYFIYFIQTRVPCTTLCTVCV